MTEAGQSQHHTEEANIGGSANLIEGGTEEHVGKEACDEWQEIGSVAKDDAQTVEETGDERATEAEDGKEEEEC
jgi:hypothetical protein